MSNTQTGIASFYDDFVLPGSFRRIRPLALAITMVTFETSSFSPGVIRPEVKLIPAVFCLESATCPADVSVRTSQGTASDGPVTQQYIGCVTQIALLSIQELCNALIL